MNAVILSVGTELLFGQIINTNAAWLSSKLQNLGINVLYHFSVGDNENRLRSILDMSLRECDLVITTGGLGPTQDDITKEIITECMQDTLVLDEKALAMIEELFSTTGRGMTENNRKQAMVPGRSTVFYNDAGTAPGFALEKDGRLVIALPGPPREMKYLFNRQVEDYLKRRSGASISYKIIRFYGIGESQLETDLLPLIDDQHDPTIATYAKEGECSIRIASRRDTHKESERCVEEMTEKVRAIAGQYIYSEDDEDLPDVVAARLLKGGLTLSSAESCTGGMFSGILIENSGISAVYDRGFVTYSNRAKTEELGVPEELIERCGAVSEEVAVAMAEGARRESGTDIGISVTGVAGPDGGTEDKPVGTAWIACVFPSGIKTKRVLQMDRGRHWNRYRFTLEMFNLLNRILCETVD